MSNHNRVILSGVSAPLLSGVPVMFGFLLPPFDEARFSPEPTPFIVFDFSIKDKEALTRRDFEYDAIGGFAVGGKWQGPPELGEHSK